ncbi:putative transaldolase [Candidatus Clavichlamydia salmonicola]|uniref:transaldolase family protein n=1 Tax=Candidatus Clavichlamydia salmonicola TaxID=469812 RepID=UPI001890BAB4|nr:transaldolase family protein [Candidatus Clavichlamydia salmonicola]MBF5051107.1 putative transaldolase [Candidatus Clavichlamydia salmonicola]
MVTKDVVPSSFSKCSIVVADGADAFEISHIEGIQDVTTNPSLIISAVSSAIYEDTVKEVSKWSQSLNKADSEKIGYITDYLTVSIGVSLLKLIPGRVSTEVDPRLAFDTTATLERARRLILMYDQLGVAKDRILIKVPATWEGIHAAEILEKEGIHCNLTLIFNHVQALACAEANVTLISPFVGRITEWYRNNPQVIPQIGATSKDSGVAFVSYVYNYFKKFGFKTLVMAASFRHLDQILSLCGCDLITIGLSFLKELAHIDPKRIQQHLNSDQAIKMDIAALPHVTQNDFTNALNEDLMAKDLLKNGIERFTKDAIALEDFIKNHSAFS